MYKTVIHCLNDQYFLETEGEVNVFCLEGMVYIQNQEGKEIFSVNKDRLEVIDLNTYEEVGEGEELIYDEEEAIDFIDEKLVGIFGDTKRAIKHILDLEEDYMRSIGMIED